MFMTSSLRKLGLTAHVTSSLGWIGAVAALGVFKPKGLTPFGRRSRPLDPMR